MIVTDTLGVPAVIHDEGLIPLNDANGTELVALALDDLDVLDALMRTIKVKVSEIAGIDPALEDGEWFGEFNRLLLINEFTTPLRVIGQARREVQRIESEEWQHGEG